MLDLLADLVTDASAATTVEVGVHAGKTSGVGDGAWRDPYVVTPFGASAGADAGVEVGRVWLGATASALSGTTLDANQLDHMWMAGVEAGYAASWRFLVARPYLLVGGGAEHREWYSDSWAWPYCDPRSAATLTWHHDVHRTFPLAGLGAAVLADFGPAYAGVDATLIHVAGDTARITRWGLWRGT